MLPAGGGGWVRQGGGGSGREGVGQVAETESTLALAENVYVNLPRPHILVYCRMIYFSKGRIFQKILNSLSGR